MKDISFELTQVMSEKQCSPLLALILVENYGISIQQPESDEESRGRLRNSGNINNNE